MDKVEILVICKHESILQTIIRLININPEWNATGAATDEEALSAFNARPFRLVLLGSGVEKETEYKLAAIFRAQNPAIIIADHYGGGSGLLTAEIYEALK